jgi:hypothetical protein
LRQIAYLFIFRHLPPSDAVASVLLAEWPVTTDYFDGATVSGPVPRLFATNPDEALEALNGDQGLQGLAAHLFAALRDRKYPAGGGVGLRR